jgi:hypothetical protein
MYTKQIEEYYNVDQVDNEQYQFEEEYKEVDEYMYRCMFYKDMKF